MTIRQDLPPIRRMPAGHDEQLRAALVRYASSRQTRRRAALAKRRIYTWLAALGAAGTGAVLGINLLTASNAYASWTSVPDQITGPALLEASTNCQHNLSRHFPSMAEGLQVALGERRGDFTATVLSAGTRVGVCVTGVPHGELGGVLDLQPLSAGTLLSLDASPGILNGPDAVRQAVGRVNDPLVSKVVVETADRRDVTASIGAGLYVAWWPSGADVTVVKALDAQGHVLGTATGIDSPLTPQRR